MLGGAAYQGQGPRPRGSGSLLKAIAKEVAACQLCPLAAMRNKAVPGEGPLRARAMLVGEAPGREEDLVGHPFVGRAGKLLDATLETLGVSRDGLFITNVVKCRPPGNRQPKKGESDTCIEAHFRRQIKAVRPGRVILLGRTAAVSLLGARSLAEVRGKTVRRGGVPYFVTYHPAAVLRNPRLGRVFRNDLERALSGRASKGVRQ